MAKIVCAPAARLRCLESGVHNRMLRLHRPFMVKGANNPYHRRSYVVSSTSTLRTGSSDLTDECVLLTGCGTEQSDHRQKPRHARKQNQLDESLLVAVHPRAGRRVGSGNSIAVRIAKARDRPRCGDLSRTSDKNWGQCCVFFFKHAAPRLNVVFGRITWRNCRRRVSD